MDRYNKKNMGGEGSRITLMKKKIRIQVWVIICGYVFIEDKSSEVEGKKIYMNLELCSDNTDKSDRIIQDRDMNAKVSSEKIQEVVGAKVMPGTNDVNK